MSRLLLELDWAEIAKSRVQATAIVPNLNIFKNRCSRNCMSSKLAEKTEKQRREIENIKSRENAEIVKVAEEERLKAEGKKLETEEKLGVQFENKNRQIIVAQKNKERTEAVEKERVEKDRALEHYENDRRFY